MFADGRIQLSAMMGTYPKTAALKSGDVKPAGADLVFAPVDSAQQAFKPAVNELKFDVAEVAIVTFLLAYAAGRPLRLLPFIMNGMFHHKSILHRIDRPVDLHDLSGKRIAMRSYSQTTPTWVRGILSDDYGLDVKSVRWLSQEGAHVTEYVDPPWVERLDPGRSLEELLLAGEVDAIVAGGGLSGDPRITPVIADPAGAALDWYRRRGATPINHMVCVRAELAERRPDLVRDVYAALNESRACAAEPLPQHGVNLQPAGFKAVKPALEMIVRFASEQGLIPTKYAVEELFGSVLPTLHE